MVFPPNSFPASFFIYNGSSLVLLWDVSFFLHKIRILLLKFSSIELQTKIFCFFKLQQTYDNPPFNMKYIANEEYYSYITTLHLLNIQIFYKFFITYKFLYNIQIFYTFIYLRWLFHTNVTTYLVHSAIRGNVDMKGWPLVINETGNDNSKYHLRSQQCMIAVSWRRWLQCL